MILASLADMYGPQVLAEPPREGFNWLGWIMPYVALLLGGGAVAFVIWRWKASPAEGLIQKGAAGRPRPAGMAPEQAAKLVDKYQSEIDRELARD
jgi:cytochrome c-type biogenesis protein CcmH